MSINTSDNGFNPSFNMATIKQVFNEAVERVRSPTPMRLRDLIRQIRASKTAAEERSVVNRETACIRNAFREEDNLWRCRNIAKILYIHMLGYPTHFAQLECLKLIASSRFTDKRIGYLGAMLLLDERQDVHLLITNSLQTDMNGPNQYIVGLALCTLGAIASPEMSRDLASEVERLLRSQNYDIRKKAALCAFRIVLKVPELMEMFLPATRSLLSEKNHGILVTGITLITEMCERSPDMLQHFKRVVPNLVRILKNLILAGYSPEHDVCGINDPFLQVKILRLLRILGRNDAETSEAMNDILAQVATNTESNKNVGYTILYETVLSIMDIKSESGLRVLAVNILGRFLLNNDKNIRYVALNTLLKTVHIDTTAVQRHRSTILDCLEDVDVSIRKRALELSFALINSHNIRNVMIKLLKFLEKADPDFKAQCSSNIVLAAEKYSPNIRWHLDTLLNVLVATGNYVRDDVISSTILLISESETQHSYIVHKLWDALQKDTADRQPLTQVATWVIGEFGDLLLTTDVDSPVQVTENEILIVYRKLLWSSHYTISTKQYALNSLMKLSSRFSSHVDEIREVMQVFSGHIHMELQQRGSEYSQIFSKYNSMLSALLERMPALETSHTTQAATGDITNGDHMSSPSSGDELVIVDGAVEKVSDSNSLLVLLSGDGNDDILPEISCQSTSPTNQDLLDLLGDLNRSFSNSVNVNNVIGTSIDKNNLRNDKNHDYEDSGSSNNDVLLLNSVHQSNGNSYLIENSLTTPVNDFLDLVKPAVDNVAEMLAYDKNGLRIIFNLEPFLEKPDTTSINIEARNSTNLPISEFLFQAAVPKTFQLVMLPPSGTIIAPNSIIRQVLRVTNPLKSALRMRIRLSYVQSGTSVQDQKEINDFPTITS